MKQRNIYRIQLNLQHETGNESEKYIQDTAEFTTRNWE